MWNVYPIESHSALFASLGWSDVLNNPNYKNTCSVRMSLCLVRCGMRFPVTYAKDSIRNPRHALNGARLILTQDTLSDYLGKWWGAAERFKTDEVSKLSGRQGVISFFGIPGYVLPSGLGGHIDLLDETGMCRGQRQGFWNSARYCFWPAT
jgi:hypothetical protein